MCKPAQQNHKTRRYFCLNFIRFKIEEEILARHQMTLTPRKIIIRVYSSGLMMLLNVSYCKIPSIHNKHTHTQWNNYNALEGLLHSWVNNHSHCFAFFMHQNAFIIDNIRLPSLTSPTTFFKVRRKRQQQKLSPKLKKTKIKN